jgi:mercuric ion binding protein
MRRRFWLIAASLLAAAAPAAAADRIITLSVPGMTCVTCPIIVEGALSEVAGVISVDISTSDRTARVVFDDAATTVEALTEATLVHGYPSTVKQ